MFSKGAGKIKVSYKRHVHDDEREVGRIDLTYMDKDDLDKYILEKKQEKPKFSKLNEEQIYEMLNIKRNEKFTLAAVMNFSLYPQGVFPQLGITAVVVPGYSIGELGSLGERFTDNKRIEGTISEMLEEAMVFCKRNMKIKTIIDSETGKRNDRTEYPINAVREAILNALIHRDYSVHTEGTPIQINFFADRLEIHSPGGLYGRMTVEQLGKARPDLRNPTLATMAESLNQAENRYSGIPTIRMEMKEYGLPEPEFKNGRNEFIVILYNKEVEQKKVCLTLEDKIIEFCKEPKSRKEIAEFLEMKTTTYAYSKYISPLLKEGRLGMTIPDIPTSRNQKYYKI